MSTAEHVNRLGLMLRLRQQEVDRLQADLAAKEKTRARYQRTLTRMDALRDAVGASGAQAHPALAMNVAGYKDHLQLLRASQAQDLALADSEARQGAEALRAASLRRETLAQVRLESARLLAAVLGRQEQKRTDEQATQAWLRGGA